ncbi:MAG TPA: hypothetical protein VFA75_21415 [Nevskia sp.]|nr:hypothetical protein [Nevskia sp.]
MITEAGGCQRKRALTAIRNLKLSLAQRAAHSQLVFPPSIESGIRALIAQWLQQASEQLAAKQLEESERIDICQSAQRALIDEQYASIAALKQDLANRERMVAEFRRRIHDLEADVAAAREDGLRTATVAEERLRMLSQFESLAASRSSTEVHVATNPGAEA